MVTQTDDTRVPRSISTHTSTETSTVGIQVDRPSFTFEDIRDDDDKVLFYTGIPTAGTFECLFDEVSVGMKAGLARKTCPRKIKCVYKLKIVMLI